MKLSKINAILLAECIIMIGVLNYEPSEPTPTITLPSDFKLTSSFEVQQTILEDVQARLEQKRIEEEERLRREQEEAERQRQLQLEEERRRTMPHFNPYNVSELSNLSKEQISKMLEGTALHTLVNAYYWYEQEYQINAVFLMSLTAEESGWGRSSLAINNNNISGHKNSRGEWAYYSNWGECLEESFRLLSQEYVNPNGRFYTGPSMYDINLMYCPNPDNPNSWANNIANIGYGLMSKLDGGK